MQRIARRAVKHIQQNKVRKSLHILQALGKIGVHLVSDGSNTPYRCKLRSPSFSNLSLFAELASGTLLSDAVSILGSLDLVIPEIDR